MNQLFTGMKLNIPTLLTASLLILVGAGCSETTTDVDPSCDSLECPENASCLVDEDEPLCVCNDGYTGDECDQCDEGYEPDDDGLCVPASSPCSEDFCGEHGTCDDSTGEAVCNCETGYGGDHCEDCSAGYHDDGSGNCVADDRCMANTCSGHGECDDTGGTLSCSCHEGYDGDNCESCSEGYHRDDEDNCVEDEDCDEENPCGDHGTCDDSTGIIQCSCDKGYEEPYCTECSAGFHDDGSGNCIVDEQCMANSCSGHGECDDSSGIVSCSCNPGYVGAHCDACDDGYHRNPEDNCVEDENCDVSNPCGEHGTCIDDTGIIECVCDIGYEGEVCTDCSAGYHNDGTGTCVLDENCLPNSCSYHGTCDDSTGVILCSCNEGYAGPACENCDDGYHRNDEDNCVEDEDCSEENPCGAHGTCRDTTGVIECICDMGYQGVLCTECEAGYHDDGTGTCLLDEHCLPNSCSYHGTCDDSSGVIFCTCDEGYNGPACESCDDGYHREGDECVENEYCIITNPCGDHGTCSDSTGIIECICDLGYEGEFCTECSAGYHDDGTGTCVIDENCELNSCSYHGTCDDSSGVIFCICDEGYAGPSCENCDDGYHREGDECIEDSGCYLEDPCGEHGTCVDDSGEVECICDLGYGGETCTECSTGYHDCSGECVSDTSIDSCGTSCTPCPITPRGTTSCDGVSCSLDCDEEYLEFDDGCYSFCGIEIDGDHPNLSFALDSEDHPHYVYYDLSAGNLMYHSWTGTDWEEQIVDSCDWTIGKPAIALDSSDNPHIAYNDCDTRALKYARWTGSEWEIETVDSAGRRGGFSIVLDSSDNPHISYTNIDVSNMLYAYFSGTEWIFQYVDSVGSSDSSIALDSSDEPHIAYYDPGSDDLKYAHRPLGVDWETEIVDSRDDVGRDVSLAIDSSDHPHISYYDNTDFDLKYAYFNGTDWLIDWIDTDGSVGSRTSLALDSSDNPHISYYLGWPELKIKYAFYTGSEWDIWIANPGEWADSSYNHLALGSDDRPRIIYYNSDHDGTRLKYVQLSPDGTCSM